jgi:hypothetical protein
MIEHARSALLNGEFKSGRIKTTSGLHAAVDVESVFYLGEVTGCVLRRGSSVDGVGARYVREHFLIGSSNSCLRIKETSSATR